MTEWVASVLRFTAFPPATEITINPDQWWLAVTGELPDRVVMEPKISQYQYLGTYNEGQLSLGISPTRLDWLWAAQESSSDSDNTIDFMPILGQFSEKVDE